LKTILFVCSGNYCRSPLAEGLARLRLKQAGYDGQFMVRSAGTLPEYEGQPSAPLILEVLNEVGADGQFNPPHQITSAEIEQADLIVGIAQHHLDWIGDHYPAASSRTFLLSDLIGERWDVIDPGVQGLEPLRACRNTIDRVITGGLSELVRRANNPSGYPESPKGLNILLFDVDGVLIEDGGYYAALIATLNYFNELMGAGPIVFDRPDRDQFQSRGYVNEWDLCPLCAGILIVETLARYPDRVLRPSPFEDFLRQFRGVNVPQLKDVARPYLKQIDLLQGKPVERARDMLLNALAQLSLRADTRAVTESLLRDMFAQTHDVDRAPVTQIFQEFVIGSKLYAESYHLPPRFAAPPVLTTEDRALISSAAQAKLAEWAQADRVKVCMYTARRSLPPTDDPDHISLIGYSPEAELGMQLLGMDYPLIATGRVQWLAAKVNVPFESVTKPAPIQALAAIGAALTHEEANSLLAAHALMSHGELIGPLAALRPVRWATTAPSDKDPHGPPDRSGIHVWIVEDGILGMQATHGAIDLLIRNGLDIHAHAIGIAAGGPKAAALAPLSEIVLLDVNAALDYIASCLP
jgi:protein-tyrosine-phosphatase